MSSVDNDVRRDCRLKLTEWGINNPYEYLDLLLYCADINDEQIVEDIFAIAYGIALGKFVQKEYLEKIQEKKAAEKKEAKKKEQLKAN